MTKITLFNDAAMTVGVDTTGTVFGVHGGMLGIGSALHAVSKNGLCEPLICKKRTFYQDRLGTYIGKALKKGTVFPQVRNRLRLVCTS